MTPHATDYNAHERKTLMKSYFVKFLSREIYVEYEGCTRGRKPLDYLKEVDVLHLWIGALYIIISKEKKYECIMRQDSSEADSVC